MKKIILVILVLQSVFFYAQQMGQGRPQQNQGQPGDQKPPKFNASDVSGIFYYEQDEVVSKLKIKDEEKEYLVIKALRNYNHKIKEISFLNTKNFKQVDALVNAVLNSSKTAPSELEEGKKIDVKGVIGGVVKEVQSNEKKLNDTLEGILTKKQHKKWLKYQKKKKRSLLPKRPSAGGNRSASTTGAMSRRTGMNTAGGMRR